MDAPPRNSHVAARGGVCSSRRDPLTSRASSARRPPRTIHAAPAAESTPVDTVPLERACSRSSSPRTTHAAPAAATRLASTEYSRRGPRRRRASTEYPRALASGPRTIRVPLGNQKACPARRADDFVDGGQRWRRRAARELLAVFWKRGPERPARRERGEAVAALGAACG